ncbi:MAG: leucyl/phenylalanyl-tRNA--protein transferase [Planctomycetota bacterium]
MASRFFPPADHADADGLLAFGGDLSPEWLLDAYHHGIFPWPTCSDEPVYWWSPDPRAVIEPDNLHISRSLLKRLRSGAFAVTCDRDFRGVIEGCATAPGRRGGTWLTPAMIDAYAAMYDLGHAHSVEAWRGGRLVGGVYGVAVGAAFAAESMFHRETDASKVALVHLVRHLATRGYTLIDIQQWTPHSGRMGATEISRQHFLARLAVAARADVTFGDTLEPLELPTPRATAPSQPTEQP